MVCSFFQAFPWPIISLLLLRSYVLSRLVADCLPAQEFLL